MTLLDTSLAKAISWVTTSMVMPLEANVFITSNTSPTISGSRADVGSSKRRISGLMARALAMATLCFCPPDSCRGFALIYWDIPTFDRYSMAIFLASSLFLLRTQVWPTIQFSNTSRLLKRLKLWNTIPTLVRYLSSLTSPLRTFLPWKKIFPSVASSSILIHLRSVDFPLPDEPMILMTSPLFTEKSISLSTLLVPKDFTRCSTFNSSSISVYLL